MGPTNEEQEMVPYDDVRIHQLHVPGMVKIMSSISKLADQQFGDMVYAQLYLTNALTLYGTARNRKSTRRGDSYVQGFVGVGEWSDGGRKCGGPNFSC